ncbi:ATP-dependent DNA ligase [archaeon]|nr:ATP-dependent DNA ligase [archaeon]
MDYKMLSDVFLKLEKTSERLKKTEILSEFLESCDSDDIYAVVLLVSGRVFPQWSQKDIGVASMLMVKAIAKAYGRSEADVEKQWQRLGDLGLVAEDFSKTRKQATLFKKLLTVKLVHESLKNLVNLEGMKSQDKKLAIISSLLTSANDAQARYVVRAIIGDLRIGVADGVIRDSITRAYFSEIFWKDLLKLKINKKKRIEHMLDVYNNKRILVSLELKEYLSDVEKFEEKNTVTYLSENEITKIADFWKKTAKYDVILVNETDFGNNLKSKITGIVERANEAANDFAMIAKIAMEEGVKGLEKIDITVGRPIKVMLAQKAKGIKDAFDIVGKPAAFEYKYDGFRLQVHKNGNEINLFTRRLENVTKQFPDIVDVAKKGIIANSCIVEGEAVGYDKNTGRYLPFQQISRRIRRKYDIGELAKQVPVVLNLFDMLSLNGKTIVDEPFEKRRDNLKKIVKETPQKLILAKDIITDLVDVAEDFYKESLAKGNEGIMAKSLSAPYKPGSRVGHMLKIKPVLETLDLTIVGALWGEGKRAGWLSSYTLACRDPDTGEFLTIGKLGTGIKEKSEEGTSFADFTKELEKHIISKKGKEVDISPTIVVEVAYEEIQKSTNYSSGFALRFPRLVVLRDEKAVEETDDLNKVSYIFAQQRHNN